MRGILTPLLIRELPLEIPRIVRCSWRSWYSSHAASVRCFSRRSTNGKSFIRSSLNVQVTDAKERAHPLPQQKMSPFLTVVAQVWRPRYPPTAPDTGGVPNPPAAPARPPPADPAPTAPWPQQASTTTSPAPAHTPAPATRTR